MEKSDGFSVHFDLNEHFYSEIIEFTDCTIHLSINFNSSSSDFVEYWRDEWIPIESMLSKNDFTEDERIEHIRKRSNKFLEIASRVLGKDVVWNWDEILERDDDIMAIVRGNKQ